MHRRNTIRRIHFQYSCCFHCNFESQTPIDWNKIWNHFQTWNCRTWNHCDFQRNTIYFASHCNFDYHFDFWNRYNSCFANHCNFGCHCDFSNHCSFGCHCDCHYDFHFQTWNRNQNQIPIDFEIFLLMQEPLLELPQELESLRLVARLARVDASLVESVLYLDKWLELPCAFERQPLRPFLRQVGHPLLALVLE